MRVLVHEAQALIDKAALRTALSVSELPLRYHIGRDVVGIGTSKAVRGPRAYSNLICPIPTGGSLEAKQVQID